MNKQAYLNALVEFEVELGMFFWNRQQVESGREAERLALAAERRSRS